MALEYGLVDAGAGLSGTSGSTLRRDSSHAAADLYHRSGDAPSSRRIILQCKVSYAYTSCTVSGMQISFPETCLHHSFKGKECSSRGGGRKSRSPLCRTMPASPRSCDQA